MCLTLPDIVWTNNKVVVLKKGRWVREGGVKGSKSQMYSLYSFFKNEIFQKRYFNDPWNEKVGVYIAYGLRTIRLETFTFYDHVTDLITLINNVTLPIILDCKKKTHKTKTKQKSEEYNIAALLKHNNLKQWPGHIIKTAMYLNINSMYAYYTLILKRRPLLMHSSLYIKS